MAVNSGGGALRCGQGDEWWRDGGVVGGSRGLVIAVVVMTITLDGRLVPMIAAEGRWQLWLVLTATENPLHSLWPFMLLMNNDCMLVMMPGYQ